MSARDVEPSPDAGFSPTHEAPTGGIAAWDSPDSSRTAGATIDGGVRFTVAERRGEWARVVCSNGWSGWVDGRRIIALMPVGEQNAPSDAHRQRPRAPTAPGSGASVAERTSVPPASSAQAERYRGNRFSAWLAWEPPTNWPPWLRRAIGIGPLLGAAFGGAMLYIPSHSLGQSFQTSFLTLALIGGLRALDPALKPFWAQVDRIPRGFRMVAGVIVPIWFSISRFGPSAAGHEVSTAQNALLVSTAVAYVLLRPPEKKS